MEFIKELKDMELMGMELKKKRLYGPDVVLIQNRETALVEKTYRNRGCIVRIIGCLLIKWERYIYSKLKGISGIPDVVQSHDRYTLTTVFMGGRNLKSISSLTDNIFFERLEGIIHALHNRGVVHLDMRNRRNYGMDDNGMPYLVDFATSLYLPIKGPLWRILCSIDWMGYLKLKAKLNPGQLTYEEKRQFRFGNTLSRVWILSKIIPSVRRLFRRIFQ